MNDYGRPVTANAMSPQISTARAPERAFQQQRDRLGAAIDTNRTLIDDLAARLHPLIAEVPKGPSPNGTNDPDVLLSQLSGDVRGMAKVIEETNARIEYLLCHMEI